MHPFKQGDDENDTGLWTEECQTGPRNLLSAWRGQDDLSSSVLANSINIIDLAALFYLLVMCFELSVGEKKNVQGNSV